MPAARQPAAAPRDRAERHVFERLPELAAVERRVLALLELCDADRAVVGADLGIDEEAVGHAAARARKALRRSLAPLSSGARCERAEVLVSDRLDGGLDRLDAKWLDIHLARCPRCEEHVRLLDEARADLRAAFVAQPPLLPAAAEVAQLEGGEGAGRLRLVPPSAPAEPAVAPNDPVLGTSEVPTAGRLTAWTIAAIVAILVLIAAVIVLLSAQ